MFCLLDDKIIIHILSQSLGRFGAELIALDSNSSMNALPVRGLMGKPIAALWTCSKYIPWKRKWVSLRQNSSKVMICWMDMEVLWESRGSCSSIFLTMEITGYTGTDVKRTLTSLETMHFPCCSYKDLICSMKFWVFQIW